MDLSNNKVYRVYLLLLDGKIFMLLNFLISYICYLLLINFIFYSFYHQIAWF